MSMNYPGSTREQAYGAAARSRGCWVSARCTSSLAVASLSTSVMTFDTLEYDRGGFWDISHQTQFFIPVSGLYRIEAGLFMLVNDVDVSYDVRRTTVGNVTAALRHFPFALYDAGVPELLKADFYYDLSAGEYVDLLVTNDDAVASKTITANSYSDPFLALTLIRAAGSGA